MRRLVPCSAFPDRCFPFVDANSAAAEDFPILPIREPERTFLKAPHHAIAGQRTSFDPLKDTRHAETASLPRKLDGAMRNTLPATYCPQHIAKE
jgi:hypothetical protein